MCHCHNCSQLKTRFQSKFQLKKEYPFVSFTKVFHLSIVNLYQKERERERGRESAGRPRSMPYQQKILEHFRAALPETTDLTEGQVGILFFVAV